LKIKQTSAGPTYSSDRTKREACAIEAEEAVIGGANANDGAKILLISMAQ
jgi:hypothetical protein